MSDATRLRQVHLVTYYRQLADDLRYKACLTPDPETREQLKVAARDYEQIAQATEDDPGHAR
jgi:hypothetical protein